MKVVSEVGARILGALKHKGQTQLWLAGQVGVTPQAITKWIRTGEISRERALRVAAALDLSVDALLAGEDIETAQRMLPVFRDLPAQITAEVLDFLEFQVARSNEMNDERRQTIQAAIDAARTPTDAAGPPVERRKFREFSEWPGVERRRAHQQIKGRRRS